MRLATVAVCVLLLSTGCLSGGTTAWTFDTETETATVQTPTQPTTPSSSQYDVDVPEIENRIHERMNERRQRNGVKPLHRNKTLDAIAGYKSWDMAQRDYFAHTGPNGTLHSTLRERYGANCIHFGQNLYLKEFENDKQNIYEELIDANQIGSDAVSALLNSSGHRENALSSNYDSQGIGVFVDENGSVFVTQELCG